ncbi:MAG TPA: AEC family transporter [Syntrophorhabdaceae bacterium]|nr:AEC family transporter [Syntrophorhabdaceae bacterium]HRV22377.1 AEC family transporter [Syntrophorhabdaceae bacterium]
MAVLETIIPIFLIIIFGYIIHRNGFLNDRFILDMNKFIFLFPLPTLIFTGIIKSDIKDVYLSHILSVILPTFALIIFSFLVGWILKLRAGRLGTFMQTSFHGNVSYIGLAVLFYLFGEKGLKQGSILIGLMILLNNSMAIAVLSWSSRRERNIMKAFLSIIKNPVIIATFLGLIVLYTGITIPKVILRGMVILSNIALPMALIMIGASIAVENIKRSFRFSFVAAILKLLVLPGFAALYSFVLHIPFKDIIPVFILLATPTATTSYIMAHEIGGDPELASNTVTLSTIISPITFILWANIAGV